MTATAPMAFGRRQHNLTVLADGSVLATGGNSSGAPLVDLDHGVYAAERWDPATGQWKTLAAMQVTRQYHSTALLLPDGRVLSAGGGICGTCDQVGYLAKNAEIFSPPYLFQADGSPAPRPAITSVPSTIGYGGPLDVGTANPAAIRKVALIRLGAVTHSDNMEQRYVPLAFTAGATRLTATGPANANIAPPGPYMLVIVDDKGVPSVASMISLQGSAAPTVALTQPASGATTVAPATIALGATAADVDGTVTGVAFYNGAAKLGEDATARYAFSWSGVGPGTYTLTARATDDSGQTVASAPATITVTGPPPTAAITSPANGAVYRWRTSLIVRATAADVGGQVTKVVFRDGTRVLAQDATAPYAFTWRNLPAGIHMLTARATDNDGFVTTSAPVRITVRRTTAGR